MADSNQDLPIVGYPRKPFHGTSARLLLLGEAYFAMTSPFFGFFIGISLWIALDRFSQINAVIASVTLSVALANGAFVYSVFRKIAVGLGWRPEVASLPAAVAFVSYPCWVFGMQGGIFAAIGHAGIMALLAVCADRLVRSEMRQYGLRFRLKDKAGFFKAVMERRMVEARGYESADLGKMNSGEAP